jgi:hypothetical protein
LRRTIPALLSILLLTAAFAQEPARSFDGKSWWEQVKVLADDNMEGRDTGSAGLRKAQAYVVAQLKALGLQPKGTRGFYQPVKFTSRQIVESDSSLALLRDGSAQALSLGEDAYLSARADWSPGELKAPLVFVGYGLRIPEKNYNDLEGLDLKGKVVVYISGSPAEVPSALSAHYQSVAERWKALREAGVIGIVSIPNPASTDIPWSRMALNRTHPGMELASP